MNMNNKHRTMDKKMNHIHRFSFSFWLTFSFSLTFWFSFWFSLTLTLSLMSSLTLSAHDELYVYRHGASQPDTIQLSSPMSISHSRTDLSGREHSDYVVMAVRLQGGEVCRYELAQLDSVVMQRGDQRIHLTRFVGRMGGNGAKTRRALRRTSLQGDDLMAETSDVNFFWETDDHIWLADGRQSLDTLLERSQAETAEFFFSGERLTDSEVVVYYSGTNGSSYNTVRVASSQTQELPDNTEHIGIAGDCGTAVATRNENQNQNQNQNENSYSFMLDHKASYLCFLPYIANDLERTRLRKIVVRSDSAIAGVFTLSPEGIRPKEDTTHTVTLTTGDFVLPRMAQPSTSAYMVIAPQNGSTRLTCEFTVYDTELQSTGTYTKIVDLDRVEPNMLYVIKANLNNYVVDLGLPVKFLNHNMGAYAPEEYGGYYAWGELTDKGAYNGGNSSQYDLYKTYVGDDIRLTGYDVAHVRMGQNFSMPNVAEMRMLGDSCTFTYVTLNGVKGCKFTRNGNNLFLPYAGYRSGTGFTDKETKGYYYTSTRSNSKEELVWQFLQQNNAVLSIALTTSNYPPYLGKSIRPVISSGMTMTDGTLVQVTTDSVQWSPGLTTARLFATVNGYNRTTTVGKTTVEAGFVVGDTPDVTLADGTRRVVAVAADGAYHDDFPDVANNHEYFYRAYVKTSGDSIFYGKPLRFGRRLADLKLPSGNLWSGINIGSPTPYKDGDYYAWGETATKKTNNESNWKWYGQQTYFFPDGLNNVQATRHDVVAQQWGEVWMLPDADDMRELYDNCSFKRTSYNGLPGYIVKNKTVASDSIFVVYSGYGTSSSPTSYASQVRLMSASMRKSDNRQNYNFLFQDNNYCRLDSGVYVYNGFVARPVYKHNATAANGQPVFVRTLQARRTYDGVTETDTLRAVIRGLDIAGSDNTYGIVWWKEGATTANYQPLTAAADGHLVYDLKGQEAGATYCYAAYFDNGTDKFYGDTLSVTTVGLVDLGLSVKWATANIGLEAGGDFYRWGASDTYLGSVDQQSKSQFDISVERGNDTAENLWGTDFRMPSKAEFDELMDENKCTRQWTTRYGVAGYLFTSNVNGNSIFLPARGYYHNTGYSSYDGYHQGWNTEGRYWTTTVDGNDKANYLQLKEATRQVASVTRADGLCVRPVQDKYLRAATISCDWTVFETTPETPTNHTTAATLSGSVFIPAAVDVANVTYGFIVGTIDQVDTSTPSVANEVPASNRDAWGRYSVVLQYDGSAKFFRAYAKIGNDYYLGAVKAVTAADLLDVEFRADNTAFNATFSDLKPVKYGSPATALNDDYHRYVADFTGNGFGTTTANYYTSYYGHLPSADFKDKMADGHTLEVLFMMPASPASNSESAPFAGYSSGSSGISIYNKHIHSAFYVGNYKHNETDITPSANTWYHVVASWNKSTGYFDIYVNGVSAGTISSLTGSFSHSGQPYYVVGGDVSSGTSSEFSFNGYVAYARIYDNPLTAGQVKTLYNALTK